MKKALKVLLLFVLIAATILTASGCSSQTYEQVAGTEKKTESALEAQPEVDDSGEAIEFTVSGTFSDNMVLQRDKVIQVWGWSENEGGYIYGELLGETRYAQVDENGEWLIQFSPKEYSAEATDLRIYTKHGEEVVFKDVLIGDVWIVSGQSNAEFLFKEMTPMFPECYDEIDENDNIRLYRENKNDASSGGVYVVYGEQDDVINKDYCWTKTTTETVDDFSAVGYMFVNELAKNTDVPQGIIMAAAGGAGITLFMDPYTGYDWVGYKTNYNEENAVYKFLLAPFEHMSIQGILFYQGESDNEWAAKYPEMLTACVAGWREAFDSTFDFYNIQCTSHAALVEAFPGLPGLRAAQLDAYYTIPDSYIVSTVDVGYRLRGEGEPEEDYAHTFDKKTIGARAAHIALAELYGDEDFKYEYVSCPIPSKVSWSGGSVKIDFTNVGDGLKAYEGDLIGFQIMQEDGTTVAAEAKVVDEDTVKVSIPNIEGDAIAVCYAFNHSALLEEANLVNSNNIPCPTFKFYSDKYEG